MNDYESKPSELCNLLSEAVWSALVKAGAPIYEMEFRNEGDDTWNRDEGAAVICLPDDYLLMCGHMGDINVISPDEIKETFGDDIRFCRWESKDGPPDLEPEADHLAEPHL